MTRRRAANPNDESAMCSAFLEALERRVARNSDGEVVLPTGITDVAELGQVLKAIDRARLDVEEGRQ